MQSNSYQALLPKTTSNNLFQIFTPSLFMASILEKNEKFVNLLETFFQGPKELSSKKILYNLYQILTNSVFLWFLFLRNPKTFFIVYSNSHQAVLPKVTSHNLFQNLTPSLFMGFILEKNEKFLYFLKTFFKGQYSSKKSLYNLFTIFIKL